jgi:D-alanyl-D-alanine dipeptidase
MPPVAKYLLWVLILSAVPARAQYPYGLKVISAISTYDSLVAADSNQALVELDKRIPDLKLDIKYASSDNLMGKPVYQLAQAFLRRPAAIALLAVQKDLKAYGYGLMIFDGYRPYRATVAFYEKFRDSTYVASPYTGSRHNRGCAVDLTLYDLHTEKPLAMPTRFDSFDKQAWASYPKLSQTVLKNRKLLQDVMLRHGFNIYPYEWWHFDYAGWKQFPLMDIPFEQLLSETK